MISSPTAELSFEERAENIKDRLKLDNNQFMQMKIAMRESQEKMALLPELDMENLQMEEVMAHSKKAEKIQKETEEKFAEIFTPAQMEDYRKMKQEEHDEMMKQFENMPIEALTAPVLPDN